MLAKKNFLILCLLLIIPLSFSCFGESSSDTKPPATTPPSGYVSVRTTNNSSYVIYDMYISLHSSSVWGTDQLSGTIPTGGSYFTLTNIPVGTYDMKWVDSRGYCAYSMNQALTAGGTTYYVTITAFGTCAYGNCIEEKLEQKAGTVDTDALDSDSGTSIPYNTAIDENAPVK